jgi:hypothetical protein
MIKYPRLKTFLTIFPLSETTWGIRGGTDELWRIKLTDERAVKALGALLPYLNGRTAAEDALAALERDGIHRGAAAAVLRQLEASSLLEEADSAGLAPAELDRFADQIRFFSRFGNLGGARFQAALGASRVGLLGGGALAESLYRQLAGAGFGEVVVLAPPAAAARSWQERLHGTAPAPMTTTVLDLDRDEIWPAAAGALPQVLVVCQDAHDPLLLEAVDALSKRRRLPWLLVRHLDLQEGWVGPLFVPGETASYLSFEARLRGNLPCYPEYLAFDQHVRATAPAPPVGGLHAAFDLLASIAVIELIKFAADIKVPQLLGRFLTVNLWTWETEMHDVLRVPALDRPAAAQPTVFPWKVVGHDDGATAPHRA